MPAAAAHARHARAPPFVEPPGYTRHRPESTLLYQLVEQHYPAFREMRAMAGRSLPDYIDEEFDAYLKCGWLEEGFLRVRCAWPRPLRQWVLSSPIALRFLLATDPDALTLVLGAVYRTISGDLLKTVGLTRANAPQPPRPPTAAWINPPKKDTAQPLSTTPCSLNS